MASSIEQVVFKYQVWTQSSTTDIPYRLLRWLGLLLPIDYRYQRDMYLQKVILSCPSPELPHRLNEWSTLDIPHSSPKFDDAHVRLFIRVVHGYSRHTLDPVLDGIGQVRHHLHRPTKIVPSAFTLDNVLIYFASGDVVFTGQGDAEVALVIAKI